MPLDEPQLYVSDSQIPVRIDAVLKSIPVSQQYFNYSPSASSLRIVTNYLFRVGFIDVFRKVRSRLLESRRNQKSFFVGIGLTSLDCSKYPSRPVLFVAPSGYTDQTHVAIDSTLCFPLSRFPVLSDEGLATLRKSLNLDLLYTHMAGWSPYSGQPISEQLVRSCVAPALALLNSSAFDSAFSSQQKEGKASWICRPATESSSQSTVGDHSAVLFGFGNYAKTCIVPNISPLTISRVHEIDRHQLLTANSYLSPGTTYSLSPVPDFSVNYTAWVIAGFHHTHASLAVEALKRGSIPVIEKPLFTTHEQFSLFSHAIAESSIPFYSCFHKRYSVLHQWFLSDVGKISPALCPEYFDMHCIVHEVPLPSLHWYRWPNSGSRLISNGCHWLDYFMYVNDYSPVQDLSILSYRSTNFSCSVTLSNGATLTLVITDEGSSRVGVRDYIEIRFGRNTVKMIDSSSYQLETVSSKHVCRRVNPLRAYRDMYSSVSDSIFLGRSGDAARSLRSSVLALDLQSLIQS